MNILERMLALVEMWEQGQDEYWDEYFARKERKRKEFEECFGFLPPLDNWCSTIEVNERLKRIFRKKLLETKHNPK